MKKKVCFFLFFSFVFYIFAAEFKISPTFGYTNIYNNLYKTDNTITTKWLDSNRFDMDITENYNTLMVGLDILMITEDNFALAINNNFSFYGENNINVNLMYKNANNKRNKLNMNGVYGIKGAYWDMELLVGYSFLFDAADEEDLHLSILCGLNSGYGILFPFDLKKGSEEVDAFSNGVGITTVAFSLSFSMQYYFTPSFGISISVIDSPGLWGSADKTYSDKNDKFISSDGYTSYSHVKSKNDVGFFNNFHVKIGPSFKF